MKKIVLLTVVGIVMALSFSGKSFAGEVDILVNKLVEKGILTPVEAQIVLDETKQEVAKETVEKGNFQVKWKDGLRLKTPDEKFSLKIGGRIMADTAWMQSDAAMENMFGELSDMAEFRRARLYTSGTIYDDFLYKLQLDFAGGDADFKDVYLGYKGIPYLGTIKIGHFKEPFSLNELTSSKYITFMERALPNAFAPGRNVGIGLNNAFSGHKKYPRMTYALGVFRDADNFGDVSSNEWNFTGRVTGLPWYEDNGKKLAHLGIAYSYRNPEETLRYRERPESHLAPYFVDTGSFPVGYGNLLDVEGAIVYGPLSLQGEFMQAFLDQTDSSSDTYFEGFYGQVSYFLTGEHRKYKNSTGTFSRVKPHSNFSIENKTFGAWEIAVRYSHLDLKDENIDGGILNDVSAGLNWYLNPNMRVMLDYIHSNRNGIGDADIVQTRFQVDF